MSEKPKPSYQWDVEGLPPHPGEVPEDYYARARAYLDRKPAARSSWGMLPGAIVLVCVALIALWLYSHRPTAPTAVAAECAKIDQKTFHDSLGHGEAHGPGCGK